MGRKKLLNSSKKPTKKLGQPLNPNITPQKLNEIFAIMANGESFRSACETVNLPRQTTLDRIYDDKNLLGQYTHARQKGLQHKIDTIYEKIETERDYQKARLYVDTLKWHISKVLPKLYGEHLTVSADVKADVKQSVSGDFVALFLSKFRGDDAKN